VIVQCVNFACCFVDVFHTQHSTTVHKSGSKHSAKVPLYKRQSSKQKSKMATKKSPGKFKKDGSSRTDSKTERANTDFGTGRKRHFSIQRNSGKRKKRKT